MKEAQMEQPPADRVAYARNHIVTDCWGRLLKSARQDGGPITVASDSCRKAIGNTPVGFSVR